MFDSLAALTRLGQNAFGAKQVFPAFITQSPKARLCLESRCCPKSRFSAPKVFQVVQINPIHALLAASFSSFDIDRAHDRRIGGFCCRRSSTQCLGQYWFGVGVSYGWGLLDDLFLDEINLVDCRLSEDYYSALNIERRLRSQVFKDRFLSRLHRKANTSIAWRDISFRVSYSTFHCAGEEKSWITI